jgi:hypothetical protein
MKHILSTITLNFTLTFILSILTSCAATGHLNGGKTDVSPFDYGLANAKTGEERYVVLLKTHKAAVAKGLNVDYTGIDTIRIEIPTNPTLIPLTQYNDFRGCVFIVKNTAKDCWLFGIHEKENSISVTPQMIDTRNFRSHDVLKQGRYLLIIEDGTPWVLKRKGYDYGHQRRDILLIEKGMAKNSVIMPYYNEYSSPKCKYIRVKDEPLVIKNITIKRDSESNKITHIATISGFNKVQISNLAVYTPESNLANDRGIRINNCTNVTLEDVRIEGTYSQHNHSGYGVNMNNIWNFKAIRMHGKANWGVFGNNNINTATIEDSQLNRFDIHCYGKDVSFKNDTFSDLYNQYSSVYGRIIYESCTFTDFVPVLNGGSYNSFVAHEVVFKDCIFNATAEKYYLFKLSHLSEPANTRHELAEKCLPNVTIKNMTVNMTEGAKEFMLYRCGTGGKELNDIGGLSKIDISGLTINSDINTAVKSVTLSNVNVQTKTAVDCQMKDVIVKQPEQNFITKVIADEATLNSKMSLKGGRVKMKNVKNLKQ